MVFSYYHIYHNIYQSFHCSSRISCFLPLSIPLQLFRLNGLEVEDLKGIGTFTVLSERMRGIIDVRMKDNAIVMSVHEEGEPIEPAFLAGV